MVAYKIGSEESQKNIVGTSQNEGSTRVGNIVLNRGVPIRESNHNHPGGGTGPSKADIKTATTINAQHPDAKTNIYTINPSTYTPYDKNSDYNESAVDAGNVIITVQRPNP